MGSSTFIKNALLLCVLNASFMVAGTFLNSLVIICLWRSSQLRKKLCYFMIFVLSCFDLAVVTITHPVLILSTIIYSVQTYYEEIKITRIYISTLLLAFSMFALLTLSLESFWMIIIFSLSPLQHFYGQKVGNILITVFALFLLFLFIYLNCKIFIIGKTKASLRQVQQHTVIKKEKNAR